MIQFYSLRVVAVAALMASKKTALSVELKNARGR